MQNHANEDAAKRAAMNAVEKAFEGGRWAIAVFVPNDAGGVDVQRETCDFPQGLLPATIASLAKANAPEMTEPAQMGPLPRATLRRGFAPPQNGGAAARHVPPVEPTIKEDDFLGGRGGAR